MSVHVATRNLFQSRTRLLMSVGGIALAALLVLVLDGVFTGSENQVTVFMDRTPFDVVVSQEGVRNLHMTTSFFPREKVREMRRIEGVASADEILFTTTFLTAGDAPDRQSLAYLIGYQPGRLGGPWEWIGPPVDPGDEGIVVDERLADILKVGVGGRLKAVGREFRVAAFDAGTTSIINSIGFISFDGFEKAQRIRGLASFALVTAEPGVDHRELAGRIERRIGGVTVQTREEFAASERRVVSDMSTDVMRMMNIIAFVIGLAVTSLTLYTATLAKMREYGVMKALGVRNGGLFGIVARQAVMSLAIGLALGVALAFSLQAALRWAGSSIPLAVEGPSLAKVVSAATVLGLASAALPIARIARLRPADVFRR